MEFLIYFLLLALTHTAPSNALIPQLPSVLDSNYRRAASRLWEQPVKFSTAGQRQVDMDQYNLPLDQIVTEWSANLLAKTRDTEEGVYLGAKNDRELFVDTLQVSLPRREGAGLGLELQEIAGGRQDGLGITVVSGVIAGGCSDGSEIMIGDSISSVSVLSRANQIAAAGGLVEAQVVTTIRTECFGYDATADAILSLPPASSQDESYAITIKRIRRKPKVTVKLQYPPSQGESDTIIQLFAGENLRLGMLVRGVKLNDPLAKRFDTKSGGNCGASGLCRTCAVSVVRGVELLSPQKMNEQQMLAEMPRWRLACKAFVGYGMKEGEMTIKVNPNQWVE
jgi:hypothetical protein